MNAFSIDGGLTFWSLITFGCLFLLLARFVFKPFQRILREREEHIQASLDTAQKARDEADSLLEQNREQLDAAREETRRIINEGHRVVATMKQEASDQARRQANQMIEDARTEIDREVQSSLDDLKNTVAGLSMRISRQILKDEIDEPRHAKLADDFIERLKKRHASRTN